MILNIVLNLSYVVETDKQDENDSVLIFILYKLVNQIGI